MQSAPEPLGTALQKQNTFYLKPIQNCSGEFESFPGEWQRISLSLWQKRRGPRPKQDPTTESSLCKSKLQTWLILISGTNRSRVGNPYLQVQTSVWSILTRPSSQSLRKSALVFMKWVDFVKGGCSAAVVRFAYLEVGSNSKLLPAVLNVGCNHHIHCLTFLINTIIIPLL